MRLLVVGSFALLIAGCCPLMNTAENSFKAMRSRACAGDSAGFFAYVDRTTLSQRVAKRSGQEKNPFMNLGMNQVFSEWEDEMKKGQDGYICRLEIIKSGSTWVDLQRVSGNKSRWHFEKHDPKHLLVDIEHIGPQK